MGALVVVLVAPLLGEDLHLPGGIEELPVQEFVPKPESTEGRPWGQSLKKPEGAPLNLR